MEFDEKDAIEYMRQHVDAALSAKYADDDELYNLLDMILTYLETNGFYDIDLDDDDEVDVEDLKEYASRMLKKDKEAKLTGEDAGPFIEAYLDYEDSFNE